MLFFVENVVEFINEYGDIDEEFYDVAYEMLRVMGLGTISLFLWKMLKIFFEEQK
ncbi:hypothetical protein MmTuc01_2796 [Methanosarcina mazei Tuc01]|uniref:Uncharacterized protein n=1 Tax=Methanosarcina mazei Tuc01 TaxID=1236903 RepID=M1PC28_METMZ|nr:hypothetical protein MmTuc01_2796 [Methanosarcina mazei Tuc01]